MEQSLELLWQFVKGDCLTHGTLYRLTLFTLMQGMQPRLVYEIGVGQVESTTVFLSVLKREGGRLVSCDVTDHSQTITDASLRGHWTFHHCPSEQFAKMLTEQADLIYIDGNHSFTGVRDDVVAFWPLLKTGGFMVLHDTDMLEGPGSVLALLRAHGFETMELPWAFGFGLVRKRATDPQNMFSL